MIKPIANIHDAIGIYIKFGCARLRFQEGLSFESLLKKKIDKPKNLILEDIL